MSISLQTLTIEMKVFFLKRLLRTVNAFLLFAQEEVTDKEAFLTNLVEHNRQLTEEVNEVRHSIFGQLSSGDIITRTLANLIDAVVEYLSFVRHDAMPEKEWIAMMEEVTYKLHQEYNSAVRIVAVE